MKKLVLFMATVFVLGMSSCGNFGKGSVSASDSDSVVSVDSVDSVGADSVVHDSVAVVK